MTENERPTVIVPYQGTSDDVNCRDIFVYLRPETNGIIVESSLLRVIENTPLYREHINLIYLANIPGGFILKNGIIEDHYGYKMPFARYGGSIFTPSMRKRFEEYFKEDFNGEKVVGAFEALDILGISEEELFQIRVPDDLVLNLNCQVVKKIGTIYVVNYDIPALIHKNNLKTDIAVMLFRSKLNNEDFHRMVEEMEISLRINGILKTGSSYSRAFHYSRGPFEQVLDARGHLYSRDGLHVPLQNMQFCSFLGRRGIRCNEIGRILDNPIMMFRTEDGTPVEDCIYSRTQGASYEEAYKILAGCQSQYVAELAELSKVIT